MAAAAANSAAAATVCEPTQIGVADVRTLILLLASPEPSVCAVAIDALTKYADVAVKHRMQLLNLNVVRPLMELTLSRDAAVKKAAVACLAAVTEMNETHQDMRRRDLMEVLITTLSREDSVEIQDEAAFALANLAKDFSNKADIRKSGGIKALVKLLESPDPDVKKNAALALSTLLDDFSNRAEIRYVNGLGPLLDLLASEFPEVQENALQSLIRCAEDCNALADANGIAPLVRLVQLDEAKIKKHAAVALARACKIERNQTSAREGGALAVLMANMSSNDPGVVASSAMALSSLAKNEANQNELIKVNAVEALQRIIGHDDVEAKREAISALASFEVIKQGGIQAMLAALEKPDSRMQAMLCLSLARSLQEPDGQMVLAKPPGAKGLTKLVELLGSRDISLCRNAAYALSNATLHEPNAVTACNAGALEALLALSKEKLKSSTRFAAEAMEKLLNHHLSAKYWLRNHLAPENIIADGFYDVGFAGSNLDVIQAFPTLSELQKRAVDKRREVILVDASQDAVFAALASYATETLSGRSARQQVRILGALVTRAMGGAVDPDQLAEFGFRFRITELKLKTSSNVIPIGLINQGTFYHRALLFKALCDRIGLAPCTLVRGEYNRAWTIVDLRHLTFMPRPAAAAKEKAAPAARTKASPAAASAGASTMSIAASFGQQAPSAIDGMLAGFVVPEEDVSVPTAEPVIVDLMFAPGHMMPASSPEAAAYQRI
nr:Armadillo repeat-containing protein 3 [Polyrhizophydium stewartii]